MALAFEQLLQELASYLQTDLRFENEVYSLIVPLLTGRRQEVGATIRVDSRGREIIDFVSAVGPAGGEVDPWLLLEANGDLTFGRITVARDMIFVVASLLLTTAQPEEVLLTLREVADFADLLERRFFSSDTF